tara:strand:- start:65 stop:418 length:354 start_codon:yes stop_codon:yes gene_type:complete
MSEENALEEYPDGDIIKLPDENEWVPAEVTGIRKSGYFLCESEEWGTIMVPTPPKKTFEEEGEEPIWKLDFTPHRGTLIKVRIHRATNGLRAHRACLEDEIPEDAINYLEDEYSEED